MPSTRVTRVTWAEQHLTEMGQLSHRERAALPWGSRGRGHEEGQQIGGEQGRSPCVSLSPGTFRGPAASLVRGREDLIWAATAPGQTAGLRCV